MKIAFLVTAAALTLAAPATAANFVTNGSFETGDLTGWSQFGDTSFSGVVAGAFDCCSPTDGSFQAVFGPVNSFGGISQTLALGAGTYTVSFDLANDAGFGNYVDFGGITLLTNIPNQPYASYSFTVTVGANPTLNFGFSNPPAYYNLDNVSVSLANGAVPEPSSWAMLIAGFGIVGATARRRRAAALAA